MPEPDPQPPQPRDVSPARWLLMLLPSALLFVMPIIVGEHDPINGGNPYAWLGLAIPLMLCFALGFMLEHWRRGENTNPFRSLGFGFLILLLNYVVSLIAVCVYIRFFQE